MLEKDLAQIECAIKDHEKRGNTFTMSVLQRCYELVVELKEARKALKKTEKLVELLEECKTEQHKDEFGNYVVNVDYLLEYIKQGLK